MNAGGNAGKPPAQRGGWGNRGNNNANGNGAGKPPGGGARELSKNRGLGQKKPSNQYGLEANGNGAGGDAFNNQAPINSPDNKRKKQEDWNYLK